VAYAGCFVEMLSNGSVQEYEKFVLKISGVQDEKRIEHHQNTILGRYRYTTIIQLCNCRLVEERDRVI
jgi:hypothetical protein